MDGTRTQRGRAERPRARTSIVALTVCLAVLAQQVAVAFHLADHSHTASPGHHAPVLSHLGHLDADRAQEEGCETPDRACSDSHHHPHPAVDHLSPLTEPSGSGGSPAADLAPAPCGSVLVFADAPCLGRTIDRELAPRPPPPRTAAAPRAPPLTA